MEQYIGIPPRGIPLALRWMCFLFPCDASAAVFKLAQQLLVHLLGYLKMKRTYPSGSQKQKKSKKGGKEET